MNDLALEVRGLSKTFGGQRALREVDFTIRAGASIAVTSPTMCLIPTGSRRSLSGMRDGLRSVS